MIRHNHRNLSIIQVVFLAPHATNRCVGIQEMLGRNPANSKDHFWRYQLNLPLKVTATGGSLFSGRITIIRRPALQNIGNKNGIAVETERAEHFVKQLASPANERFSEAVFLLSRRFPNDHPVCGRITCAKYRLSAALMKRTIRTACDRTAERLPVGSNFTWRYIGIRSRRSVILPTKSVDIDLQRFEIGPAPGFS
jgi:hypothetical protein